jgi:IS1 family transposase/transposase-like protein
MLKRIEYIDMIVLPNKISEGMVIKMALVSVKCPYCGSDNVKKFGMTSNNKQRYLCCNVQCLHKTFVENYTYNAYNPFIRSRIFFSIVNGSGTRATARLLEIAKGTVTSALKSIEKLLWYVNYDYINNHKGENIEVDVVLVDEAEMDEMWSFVHDKSQQYWLWWAIDHKTGEPLAFHFGTREHKNLDELLALLKQFDIRIVYCDNNLAYKSHINLNSRKNTYRISNSFMDEALFLVGFIW